MEKRKVKLFTITTFTVSWIAWWVLVFIKQEDSEIYLNAFHFLIFFIGGVAPTIVPYLVIKLSDKDFANFNLSIVKFRVNILFYLFGIFVIFGIRFLGIWVYGIINKPIWSDLSPDFVSLIPLTLLMIVFGGLEELGWRGLLLPELSKLFNFKIATLMVSVIWAVWHLPLFFMHGTAQYQSDFLVFFIETIGSGCILAWLFGKTQSIFICVLFHALSNSTSSIGLNSPDGDGYIVALLWLIVGLGLVLLDGKSIKVGTAYNHAS